MRLLILTTFECLVLLAVSAAPDRLRSSQYSNDGHHDAHAQVKGQHAVKGHSSKPATNLRKGEYMCGNKICKLKTGEIPKGCNGVCQYPVD